MDGVITVVKNARVAIELLNLLLEYLQVFTWGIEFVEMLNMKEMN